MDARTRAEHTDCEDTFSSWLLDDIKQKVLHAFRGRGPGAVSTPQLPTTAARKGRGRRGLAAPEGMRRAHIEGAIVWLRVELLEMKSQNLKLAKTLLDLSMEIQRLRNETDVSAAVE